MTTKEVSATEALGLVKKQAAEPNTDVRFAKVVSIGDAGRQGDVYYTRVEDNHPRGAQITDHQLAPGTSKGSRHVAQDLPGAKQALTLFSPEKGSNALAGPVISAPERFLIAHPEHADHSLPSGTYQVTYQRDLALEERTRVQD